MKTILVATDFSPAADNAFRYGLDMARALQAKVVLLHAFQPSTAVSLDSTLALTGETLTKMANKCLEKQVETVRKKEDPAVTTIVQEGAAPDIILRTAIAGEATVVIMGMTRGHGLLRAFFGSTVTALYDKTTIPLIIVPEDAVYAAVSKIALASDIMPETDMHTLDLLQEIVQQFNAKVFIVRVISDRFEEVYELLDRPEKFSRLRKAVEVQYEYERSKHVVDTLNDFIDRHEINMVAMVPHKHTLLEKWFFKSTTRTMILKAMVPVLVLPEKKIRG